MKNKIVVWKNGSYLFTDASWEYENDADWLVTIEITMDSLESSALNHKP